MRLHFEEGERELLVTRLGLAEDADDAAVSQAVAAWMQEQPASSDDSGSNSDNNDAPANNDVENIDASQGDVVIVDVASFRRYQQRDRIAGEVEETIRRRDRDDLIAEAVHDGKISPSRVQHYTARYDDDPEGISKLLGRLTPNTVPLEERGVQPATDAVDDSAYPTDWVPEVAARAERPKSRVHGES